MREHDPAPRRGVPEELERALAAEVSLGSRMRHVAVDWREGAGRH